MLRPDKHLDLERSPLRVSSEIASYLARRRVLDYDRLVKFVQSKIGDTGDDVMVPSLSLLFLLGLIEYHVKGDSFEYTGGAGGDNAA